MDDNSSCIARAFAVHADVPLCPDQAAKRDPGRQEQAPLRPTGYRNRSPAGSNSWRWLTTLLQKASHSSSAKCRRLPIRDPQNEPAHGPVHRTPAICQVEPLLSGPTARASSKIRHVCAFATVGAP